MAFDWIPRWKREGMIRESALTRAQEMAESGEPPSATVARAEAYFRFLVAAVPTDSLTDVPPPPVEHE